MHERDFLQLALFIVGLVALTPPLGNFMARVFAGERHFLQRPLGWIERDIYKLNGVDSTHEMSWKAYAVALLVFNIVGGVVLLVMEMTQAGLPFNPQHLPNVPFALAFNTDQFHDQHELAGLFGRSDHELLHANGRDGRAQFCQRGDRHRWRVCCQLSRSSDWLVSTLTACRIHRLGYRRDATLAALPPAFQKATIASRQDTTSSHDDLHIGKLADEFLV